MFQQVDSIIQQIQPQEQLPAALPIADAPDAASVAAGAAVAAAGGWQL